MSTQALFTVLVLAVALERAAELAVSRRNAAWSRARGGVESGRNHYPFMVVLHTGLLAGALAEVWTRRPDAVPVLAWTMLALVAASQALRCWCVTSLGRRWNTRVIVVPGAPLVTGGPYRLLPHPNYAAVAVEGFALPLVHSAWITAVAFTVPNAVLLAVRVRTEDAALARAARSEGRTWTCSSSAGDPRVSPRPCTRPGRGSGRPSGSAAPEPSTRRAAKD